MNHQDTIQKRNLVRCPKCKIPLAEIRGSEVNILKYQDGKPMKIGLAVAHDAGGRFDLSCESCGAFSFAIAQKSLSLGYAVAVSEKKNKSVDKSH